VTRPEGLGFKDAAVQVVRTGIIRPRTVDGVPVPATFRVSVDFGLGEELPPPPPYTGPKPTPRAMSLAAQLSAETFAAHPMPEPWAEDLRGLAADRREIVLGWLNELFPHDPTELQRLLTLGIARTISQKDLETWSQTGQLPSSVTPAMALEAAGDLVEDRTEAWTELRRRFCARWDCGPSDVSGSTDS